MQSFSIRRATAEKAGTNQGFALVTSNGELALLYVTVELLHRGAGKALLVACEASARAAGIRTLILESTLTARGFYARHGYAAAGPARKVRGMSGYPMAKRLLP